VSVFSSLQAAPGDPVLGVKEAFDADTSPDKVDLGVGVYLDETGSIPLMRCVHAVEQDLATQNRPRGYLNQTGLASYVPAVQGLVFGDTAPAVLGGRVASLQGLGGTGALRVGAGLLALAAPEATVLISDPSWENHELLFSRAGFRTARYRYYDPAVRGIDVDGMLDDLNHAAPASVVVLHACCHNPTGCDLGPADWDRVIEVMDERGLVPFLDLAYQGFSQGVEPDRYAVSAFVGSGMPLLVANSFSKNFGLYGERVGAIHFVATDDAEAARVLSQAKTVVRSLYSNPPTQGAAIIAAVLNTPELRAMWEQELEEMRQRILQMRAGLRAGLEQAGVAGDFGYITAQAGLFSYSGLTVAQMQRLRAEFHIYGLDSGRLCIAGLNPRNLEYVVASIAAVMK